MFASEFWKLDIAHKLWNILIFRLIFPRNYKKKFSFINIFIDRPYSEKFLSFQMSILLILALQFWKIEIAKELLLVLTFFAIFQIKTLDKHWLDRLFQFHDLKHSCFDCLFDLKIIHLVLYVRRPVVRVRRKAIIFDKSPCSNTYFSITRLDFFQQCRTRKFFLTKNGLKSFSFCSCIGIS